MFLFGIVSAFLTLNGDALEQPISQLLNALTTHSKWLYIINFIILFWQEGSHYGHIRLGLPVIGMKISVISKVLSTMIGLNVTIWLKRAHSVILLVLFTLIGYGGEQPNRWNCMAWVIIFILFSLGIVLVVVFKPFKRFV